MMSFLNRMQALDISNVCNQVLEEIAQRATNIHPPNPLEAENWIFKIEKIFKFLGCTNSQKVNYATYMFEGPTEIWSAERLL